MRRHRYYSGAALALLAGSICLNGEARSFPSDKSRIALFYDGDLVRKVHGSHQDCRIGSYEYIASATRGPRVGSVGGRAAPVKVTVAKGYNFHRHSVAVTPGRYMASSCSGGATPAPIKPKRKF